MIIRADYEDPLLRTRHGVSTESAKRGKTETDTQGATGERDTLSGIDLSSPKMKSGHSRSKLDASTRRTIFSVARGWRLRWYSRQADPLHTSSEDIYFSHRAVGPSIASQTVRPELSSPVVGGLAFGAAPFLELIARVSSLVARIVHVKRGVRQLLRRYGLRCTRRHSLAGRSGLARILVTAVRTTIDRRVRLPPLRSAENRGIHRLASHAERISLLVVVSPTTAHSARSFSPPRHPLATHVTGKFRWRSGNGSA